MCLMNWERIFARSDAYDAENTSKKCFVAGLERYQGKTNFCGKMSDSDKIMSLTDSTWIESNESLCD